MANAVCWVSDPVDAQRENGNVRMWVNLLVVGMTGDVAGSRSTLGLRQIVLPVNATGAEQIASFASQVAAAVVAELPAFGFDLTGQIDGRGAIFLPQWNRTVAAAP